MKSSDMKEFVIEHTEKMEQVLKQVAKVLATQYQLCSDVSAPQYHERAG